MPNQPPAAAGPSPPRRDRDCAVDGEAAGDVAAGLKTLLETGEPLNA